MDEYVEPLCLRQLGHHNKPMAVFNVNGYYDNLKGMLETAFNGGFMSDEMLELSPFYDDETALLKYLEDNKDGTGDFSILKDLK